MSDSAITLVKYLAYSGPVSDLTPAISDAAQLAIDEVNLSGILLGGRSVSGLEVDSFCNDPSQAVSDLQAALESTTVSGIVGPMCSGTAFETVNELVADRQIATISPSTTHSGLGSALGDGGYFFRTIPPNEVEAKKSAEYLYVSGVRSVTILQENSGYGSDYAEYFSIYFEALGGTVNGAVAFDYNEPDISATEESLAQLPAETLLVISAGIFESSSELLSSESVRDTYQRFHLSESMLTEEIFELFEEGNDTVTGLRAVSSGLALEKFEAEVGGAFDASALYAAESYDAAAVLLLSMQAAGSSDPAVYTDYIDQVTGGAGTKIYAGELAYGLQKLAAGESINYVGASNVSFDSFGDDLGNHELVQLNAAASGTDESRLDVIAVIEDTNTYGSQSDDVTEGTASTDVFVASAGDDVIDGGEGIDRFYVAMDRDSAIVSSDGEKVTLATAEGTTVLSEVERLDFFDKSVAFDFDRGEAGYNAVTIIGTAFGSDYVNQYFAAGLSLFDAGRSLNEVAGLIVELGLIESVVGNSSSAWVREIYKNVIGVAPDPFTEAIYSNYLDTGEYSRADLLVLAAGVPVIEQQVNLSGLQESGLEYSPFI